MTVSDVPERLEERLRPARERLARRIEPADTRAPTERVGEYVAERLDSETVRTWGPRVAFLGAGLLFGFLLGWFVRAAREREDVTELSEAVPEGLAQPLASSSRGSSRESESAPFR